EQLCKKGHESTMCSAYRRLRYQPSAQELVATSVVGERVKALRVDQGIGRPARHDETVRRLASYINGSHARAAGDHRAGALPPPTASSFSPIERAAAILRWSVFHEA